MNCSVYGWAWWFGWSSSCGWFAASLGNLLDELTIWFCIRFKQNCALNYWWSWIIVYLKWNPKANKLTRSESKLIPKRQETLGSWWGHSHTYTHTHTHKHTKEENGEGQRKISVYFVISLPSLFGIEWRNASMDTIQCNMNFSHIKLHDFKNSIECVI